MKTRLLGITGRKRHGKDEVFKAISRHVPKAHRLAFADPLKEELAKACGVDVAYINRHKDRFRLGLQWWGTEFRRELCSPEYWIHQAEFALRELNIWRPHPPPLVVFTDVRFQNEADFIKKHGGKLWMVMRDEFGPDSDRHKSETEMDGYEVDRVILNTGTLKRLERRVIAAYQEDFA